VVVQVDDVNILGIISMGSPKLALNTLARKLFWFCLSHKIVMSVEWDPQEINAFADEISKWLIPDDYFILVLILLCWIVNGAHTLAIFSRLGRVIIVLRTHIRDKWEVGMTSHLARNHLYHKSPFR